MQLARYLAMTQKTKPEEVKDAAQSLKHYRTSFKNLALDYTFRQNVFHFEQRSAILSVLSQAMNAFQAYHKEGAAATKSIERDMCELSCRQQELQTQQEQVNKNKNLKKLKFGQKLKFRQKIKIW